MIDIGANLCHDSFDPDRDIVIRNAFAEGVSQIVVTGSCNSSNQDAAALAANYPTRLFATAGVHPHHASDYDETATQIIEQCLAQPYVVAVGECGLDYFRNLAPAADQKRAFEAQLDIAEQSGAPVFLHQRDALDDFVTILGPRRSTIGRAVAHCFTGSAADLDALLALDLYIGITGWICDERRGLHLQKIVDRIPTDRLLIETDAPYLLPRTLRPKPKTRRNEPRWLGEVATVVAACRGVDPAELRRQTEINARRFFDLPEPSEVAL